MSEIYGDDAKIGDNAKIGNGASIGHRAEIGDCVNIGDWAKIGDCVNIGDWANIGNCVNIGDWANIGNCVNIGDKFQCEGFKVIDLFTMANIDGTGRRVHVYIHTKGISVRAGCFKGTLDEFCTKAESENKLLYSATVRAAAEAFAAEVKRQGKTGGWDEELGEKND